jgi:hypothetical protein
MIKQTRRTLDTCSCRVIYEWDSSLPSNQITHTVISFEKCPVHAGIAGSNQDVYDNVVCKENSKKNIGVDTLLQNAPSTLFDLNVDGNRIFKKGIEALWTFTGTAPNRLLTISVIGITLTQNQKNAIQTKLNEKFGISNVVFQ